MPTTPDPTDRHEGSSIADPGDATLHGLQPDPTQDAGPIDPEDLPAVPGALLRYRVMAWIVGVLLVVLILVGMPLKYLAGDGRVVTWVGIPHGWLYALLLITAYDLGRRVHWSWTRLLLIALAGTVPFMSFVAEHNATRDVRRRISESEAVSGDAVASQ